MLPTSYILPILIALPLVGGLLAWAVGRSSPRGSRWIAVATLALGLVASAALWALAPEGAAAGLDWADPNAAAGGAPGGGSNSSAAGFPNGAWVSTWPSTVCRSRCWC